MPVLRTTAATALPMARQLAGDLGRWVRDSGVLNAAPALADQVDLLAQGGGSAPIGVDVRVASEASGAAAVLGRLVAPDGVQMPTLEMQTRIGLRDGRALHVRATSSHLAVTSRAGDLRPPILVWVSDDATVDAESRLIADASDDRPLLVVVASPATADQLRRAAAAHAWHVLSIDPAEETIDLARRLGEGPVAQALDVLRAEALTRALESLAHVLQMAHDSELRGIRAKRALLQQKVAKLQGGSSASRSASELMTDVRNQLQRQFTEFTRGVEDAWAAALAANGPAWAALEARLSTLDALDESSRAKTSALAVPPMFLEAWQDLVHQLFSEKAQADLVAMRDLFRVQTDEVVQAVARAGGPAVVVSFQFLDANRLRRVADQLLADSRPYQGELPRKGPYEYLMIARRYQMIFFMFISAFGLSFLRTSREFTIPTAILLLTLGGINVVSSVRRERHEGRRKEIDKAREHLRSEARRSLAEASRSWTTAVSQHMSDQIPNVTGQIEALVRDSAARATDEAASERQRVQRQLQGFETVERRLAAAARGRESVASALAQLRGELRQLVTSTLRGGSTS